MDTGCMYDDRPSARADIDMQQGRSKGESNAIVSSGRPVRRIIALGQGCNPPCDRLSTHLYDADLILPLFVLFELDAALGVDD